MSESCSTLLLFANSPGTADGEVESFISKHVDESTVNSLLLR